LSFKEPSHQKLLQRFGWREELMVMILDLGSASFALAYNYYANLTTALKPILQLDG